MTGARAAPFARAGALALAVLAADQGSKAIVSSALERGGSVDVFFGLKLTNVRNTGVAFGLFPGAGDVVSVLSLAAIALLVVYFLLHSERPGLWVPVGLLLGGAVGNLIDRARLGSVIDFIDPVAWPAFNLADACVVVGVISLLYVLEGPPARRARDDGRADAAA